MAWRWTVVVVVLTGVWSTAVTAATSAGRPIMRLPPTTWLAGVAIAGDRTLFATGRWRDDVRVVSLGGGRRRTVFRAAPPPQLPDDGTGPSVVTAGHGVTLAASASRVVVLRRVRHHHRPRCIDAVPPCRAAERFKTVSAAVYAGVVDGPLRRVARGGGPIPRCAPLPTLIDAWGDVVAYTSEPPHGAPCPAPRGVRAAVRLVRPGRRPVTAATVSDARISDLALAGGFVAWAEWREGMCPCSTIVVRDWRRGRTISRLEVRHYVDSLALQPDGTLAFVGMTSRRIGRTICGRTEVAVVANGRARFLELPASQLAGFSQNRLVYVAARRSNCSGSPPLRIVASTLDGRVRILRELPHTAPLALAFAAGRVVYALSTYEGGSTIYVQTVDQIHET